MSDVMIQAQDLSKSYGAVQALSKVSFDVRRGEVVGLVGPNGAGKTTTMKILTCFIAPSEGGAKVNGCDIFGDPIGVRRAIGYLPEHTPLYTEMIVYDYLNWCAQMRGHRGDEAHKRIKRVAEQMAIGDVIAKEIRALSKGYRQRVGLAQALLHEPPLLILDEPMSGLDPNQAVEIRDLIKAIGKERTVILSTHNLAEVQAACGRVLIIAKGKLVADDTPDDLRARAGKGRYLVTVAAESEASRDATASQAIQVLERIAGVDRVNRVGNGAGIEVDLAVIPRGDEDLRAAIFRAAVEGKLTLLGLRRDAANLEAIFRELTIGDDADGAAKRHDARSKTDSPDSDDASASA